MLMLCYEHPLLSNPAALLPCPPQTYIHRSGRTGRAGSTGISITLVDRKKEGLIPYIQVRRCGWFLASCQQQEQCGLELGRVCWLDLFHWSDISGRTAAHHLLSPHLPSLQTKAGLKFERVGAPQPGDMAQVRAWLDSQCWVGCADTGALAAFCL